MCVCVCMSIYLYMCIYIYMYIYIYIYIYINFFIIKCVKVCAIPCPCQLPTWGDNTVLVAQGSTATSGATKQLLPLDRVFKRIICMSDQLRTEITLDVYLHF